MFVLAILAGALSSASAATLVAAITPFNIRSVYGHRSPAVYLSGEEASEHGRMSNWLRAELRSSYNYDYPYLNSVIVLVESATRHVT